LEKVNEKCERKPENVLLLLLADARRGEHENGRRREMCDRRNGREENVAEFRDRARFYAIRQVYGERAYDWYRRVQASAVTCGFDAGRRAPAVADKFVTGLRPGPVADRLLGERVDGRLEDLLAAAVAAEEEQEEKATNGATPLVPSWTTRAEDVITEIREGLKLYRYSSGGGDAVRYTFCVTVELGR